MGPGGEAKMAEFLAGYGLDPSAIAAETFLNRAQVYEQADRMAANADKRRDALLCEIERRRAWRAQNFRDSTNIVDAEAEDVTAERPRSGSLQISDKSPNDKRTKTRGGTLSAALGRGVSQGRRCHGRTRCGMA